MPIQFPRGFKITSKEPVDIKLILTKEQMKTAHEDFAMPSPYFCICSDDNKIYVYDIDNHTIIDIPDDPFYGLGYFRPLKTGLLAGDGIEITDEDTIHVALTTIELEEFNSIVSTYGPNILKTNIDEEVKHYEK